MGEFREGAGSTVAEEGGRVEGGWMQGLEREGKSRRWCVAGGRG